MLPLNSVRRGVLTAVAFALFGTLGHAFAQEQSNEEHAWNEVQQMEAASLQSFLAAFPNGNYANEAKFYLSLHQKVAAIRSRKEKPVFVIPFALLGARWEGWQQRRPEKSAVGVYRSHSAIGIFPVLGCMTISMDWSAIPITPTGDGSILALKTYGLRFSYINNISFQSGSREEDILHFGVVHAVGLVHVHGAGKVIMPDGKETIFTELRLGPRRKPARPCGDQRSVTACCHSKIMSQGEKVAVSIRMSNVLSNQGKPATSIRLSKIKGSVV